jgi:hypothetical protein
MLVPQDSLVDFVMQCDVFLAGSFGLSSLRAVEGFARYLIDRISDQDSSDRFLSLLKELCGRVWQFDLQKGLSIFPDAVVESLLRAVAHARDWEFLEQAASCLGGCPPVDFFKWAAEQVASGEIALADIQKRYAPAVVPVTCPQLSPSRPSLTVLQFVDRRSYLYNPLRQNPCRPPIHPSSNVGCRLRTAASINRPCPGRSR